MRNIRSDILVHWTGRDIEERKRTEKLSWQKVSRLYLDRFVDIMERGFWITKNTEFFDLKGNSWSYDFAGTCFTELRLSEADVHAERYGRLGIGVCRDWIRRRGGMPVHYLPIGREASFATEYQKECYDPIKPFLKAMGQKYKDAPGYNLYQFMDEMEWRIVKDACPEFVEIREDDPDNCHGRVPVRPKEIGLVIFPLASVRKSAFDYLEISDSAPSANMFSSVLLEQCRNF